MNFESTKMILDDIKETNLQHLLKDLIEYAIRYFRIRTDYYLASVNEKREMESTRISA